MSSPTFTQSLIAGGLAGTSVDVALYPLDTLKTRLQSSQGFAAAGGFKGVYRGLGSVVVGSAPSASLFFASYEHAKALLPRSIPTLDRPEAAAILHMISASIGEISACLVRVPTEVVKQRQQTAAYGRIGTLAAAQRVLGESGLIGFYRGFGTTVAREFPLYEGMKTKLASSQGLKTVATLPSWQAALCGSLSGGIAAALTCPFDVAKTRIMLDRRQGGEPSGGTYATISRIARTEGTSALFKGVVPRVIWLSLGGAVFLGVYEAAKGVLVDGQPNNAL